MRLKGGLVFLQRPLEEAYERYASQETAPPLHDHVTQTDL